MKSMLYCSIFLTLLFGKLAYSEMPPTMVSVSEKTIVDATWSLYVWQVLGSQYHAPFWTKGTEETSKVGHKGQTDREKNVRAICLGREGDFYVFFTLRSFVDATFPNLFIQGVTEVPLGEDGKPLKEDTIISQPPVRYGGLSLVFYDDQGGGTIRVAAKISGITQSDHRNPKCFGRKRFEKIYSSYETIDNVKYERPHEKISAKDHLEFQKMPKITVRFINEHDIALLYVPVSMFTDRQVSSLGLKSPTLSVKLMLEHNKDLFGFKFILIGQETLDLMKGYNPGNVDFPGFQKLVKIAGLALDIDTLSMLKIVDKTLYEVIPDKLANARTWSEAKAITWEEIDQMALQIVTDETTLAKIKMILIPAVSNVALRVTK